MPLRLVKSIDQPEKPWKQRPHSWENQRTPSKWRTLHHEMPLTVTIADAGASPFCSSNCSAIQSLLSTKSPSYSSHGLFHSLSNDSLISRRMVSFLIPYSPP